MNEEELVSLGRVLKIAYELRYQLMDVELKQKTDKKLDKLLERFYLGVLHLYDLDQLLDSMDDCDGEPAAERDCE